MMDTMRSALDGYLRTRRALGFGLRSPGYALKNFIAFMEQNGADHITTDLAVRWATLPMNATRPYWAWRLGFVRGFAAWRKATDPRTEVPPRAILPRSHHRSPPYIYTDDEVARLLQAAAALPSRGGLRGKTYATLFGLISATGMRVSEGVALDRGDVDLGDGVLTIRKTKFRKSRLLPLHPSTRTALRAYAAARDRILPKVTCAAFFLSDRGTRVTIGSAEYNFAQVSREVGLRPPPSGRRRGHGHGPRIHDLRHRFAVATLVDWYRAGVDVAVRLPWLSTYLGHACVSDTYWYIEAAPELLEVVTERLEHRHAEVQP
jgi:integrase